MKLRKTFIIMICALVMAWLAGCTEQTPDNQAERNGDTLTQGNGYANGTMAEWQREKHEFEKDSYERIAAFNRKLGKLEGRAETAAGATKDKLEQQADELENQLEGAEAKLDSLDNATSATWEIMKAEVKTAFDNVEQAFDSAIEPMEKSRQ